MNDAVFMIMVIYVEGGVRKFKEVKRPDTLKEAMDDVLESTRETFSAGVSSVIGASVMLSYMQDSALVTETPITKLYDAIPEEAD